MLIHKSLSMHARMAGVGTPRTREGRPMAIPMPAASLGKYRSAGLRTFEPKPPFPEEVGFGASPSQAVLLEGPGPVACDALWFDYRCGGSAGITVLWAVHQLPVTFRRGAL